MVGRRELPRKFCIAEGYFPKVRERAVARPLKDTIHGQRFMKDGRSYNGGQEVASFAATVERHRYINYPSVPVFMGVIMIKKYFIRARRCAKNDAIPRQTPENR